jgi:hypothetical protein
VTDDEIDLAADILDSSLGALHAAAPAEARYGLDGGR